MLSIEQSTISTQQFLARPVHPRVNAIAPLQSEARASWRLRSRNDVHRSPCVIDGDHDSMHSAERQHADWRNRPGDSPYRASPREVIDGAAVYGDADALGLRNASIT